MNQRDFDLLRTVFGAENVLLLDGTPGEWERLRGQAAPQPPLPDQLTDLQLLALIDIIAIAQEFCERVEAGIARSTYTYGRFKRALHNLAADGEPAEPDEDAGEEPAGDKGEAP